MTRVHDPDGLEPNAVWDEGHFGFIRACVGNADQWCPDCFIPLTCQEDYIGGGSHYWTLVCVNCGKEYSYDTYRFKLEPYERTEL